MKNSSHYCFPFLLSIFFLSFSLCAFSNSQLRCCDIFMKYSHFDRTALLCLCQPAEVAGTKQKGAQSGRAENRWLSGNPACPSIIDRQRRNGLVSVCVSHCPTASGSFCLFTNLLLFSVLFFFSSASFFLSLFQCFCVWLNHAHGSPAKTIEEK